MNDVFESNFTRSLSAICLIVAPALLLTSSLMSIISTEINYPKYIFGKVGSCLFVFAIFTLVQMLKPEMEKLAIIAGGMAIIGIISGTTLYSFLYYFHEMKASGLDATAMQTSENLLRQVYLTMVFVPLPGWFFPIGLMILSIGLFAKKIIPRPVVVLLAIAAISFPMGRIPKNPIVCVTTDSLFLISMSCIAWQVFSSSLVKQRSLEFSKA